MNELRREAVESVINWAQSLAIHNFPLGVAGEATAIVLALELGLMIGARDADIAAAIAERWREELSRQHPGQGFAEGIFEAQTRRVNALVFAWDLAGAEARS